MARTNRRDDTKVSWTLPADLEASFKPRIFYKRTVLARKIPGSKIPTDADGN
jgi:hypothetical protein